MTGLSERNENCLHLFELMPDFALRCALSLITIHFGDLTLRLLLLRRVIPWLRILLSFYMLPYLRIYFKIIIYEDGFASSIVR